MIQGGGYFIRRNQNEHQICNEILKNGQKKKKPKEKKRNCSLPCFLADQKTKKKS